MQNSSGHSVLKAVTIGWSHLQSASNNPIKLCVICRCGYFYCHLTSEPTASPVLTKWWNLEIMLATNFGSPYKWLPKLVAKFWLPNLVLYQTDIGGQNFDPQGSFFTQAWKYSQYACKPSFRVWHWKPLEKMAQDLQNSLFRPYSGPKILPARVIFRTHTLESTYNMPVNQVSESDINFFLKKWPKTSNFQNSLFWPYSGPKIWPTRLIFHTLENTHNMPVNQVSWAPIENSLRKWPKTCKISNFDLFFVIRTQ